jgi:hypothetical protein
MHKRIEDFDGVIHIDGGLSSRSEPGLLPMLICKLVNEFPQILVEGSRVNGEPCAPERDGGTSF